MSRRIVHDGTIMGLGLLLEYTCDDCYSGVIVHPSDLRYLFWAYWPKEHTDTCPECTEARRVAAGRMR